MAGQLKRAASPGAAAGFRALREQELGRVLGLVADQHRRLRVVQDQLPASAAPAVVVEAMPARCRKPQLARTTLAGLLEGSRRRLELADSAVGHALAQPWPEPAPSLTPLRPSPGLSSYALRELPELPNVVISLFGRPGSEIRPIVERIVAEQHAGEPFIPIFLTNDSDFTVFRDQRLAFEYFPFLVGERDEDVDARWLAYTGMVLELTMRRWGVCRIVTP